MDILERTLSYDEVTEIFVRVNSLGAKLRSSDLALHCASAAESPNSSRVFGCRWGVSTLPLPSLKGAISAAPSSSAFKTMFLAFRAAEARDWRSNLTIALGHRGAQHRLQFHHIFPKTVLKDNYTIRAADDIANLAFIGGKTNRQISDQPPSQYFPELTKKAGLEAFQAQCIPTDIGLIDVGTYETFLTERHKPISTRLNEFIAAEPRQGAACQRERNVSSDLAPTSLLPRKL